MNGAPLTDPAICQTLFGHLAELASQGNTEQLLPYIPPDLLNELRGMSVVELMRISDKRNPILSLQIDTGKLKFRLHQLRSQISAESEAVWFLKRGAPSAMMIEIFQWNARQCTDMRKSLGLHRHTGRPPRLPEDISKAIVMQWHTLQKRNTSMIDCYKTIIDAFPEIALSSIYAAIFPGR